MTRLGRLLRRLLPEPELIGTEEYPILHRWTIFDLAIGRLAIHHIQPGVRYRHFHDHGHFMLLACFSGWYYDERRGGKLDLILPGSVRYRHPPHPHKIHPSPREGAWTICFQGPITRQEGFYVGEEWMPTEEYEASDHWPWTDGAED